MSDVPTRDAFVAYAVEKFAACMTSKEFWQVVDSIIVKRERLRAEGNEVSDAAIGAVAKAAFDSIRT